jgi:hypothetical protein
MDEVAPTTEACSSGVDQYAIASRGTFPGDVVE